MKYIVKRSGSYTTTTYLDQMVEVEANSVEEAEDLALQDEDYGNCIRILENDDDESEWGRCDEQDVSEAIEADVYYERQQLSLAFPYTRVFEEENQSGK
jgi:hypothetical protein